MFLKKTVRWAHKTHQMHSGSTEGETWLPTVLDVISGAAHGACREKGGRGKGRRLTVLPVFECQAETPLCQGHQHREGRNKSKVDPTSIAHPSPEENQAEAGI